MSNPRPSVSKDDVSWLHLLVPISKILDPMNRDMIADIVDFKKIMILPLFSIFISILNAIYLFSLLKRSKKIDTPSFPSIYAVAKRIGKSTFLWKWTTQKYSRWVVESDFISSFNDGRHNSFATTSIPIMKRSIDSISGGPTGNSSSKRNAADDNGDGEVSSNFHVD